MEQCHIQIQLLFQRPMFFFADFLVFPFLHEYMLCHTLQSLNLCTKNPENARQFKTPKIIFGFFFTQNLFASHIRHMYTQQLCTVGLYHFFTWFCHWIQFIATSFAQKNHLNPFTELDPHKPLNSVKSFFLTSYYHWCDQLGSLISTTTKMTQWLPVKYQAARAHTYTWVHQCSDQK